MLSTKLLNTLKCHLSTISRTLSTQLIEKKIPIDNVNINYVQVGNGSKSVLLMPGAVGSAWTDFKPQIEKLPNILPNYTIIAWDPPGYGKSMPPKRNFSPNFFQDDARYAKRLMETLGKDKFSILGWSDGGITGMVLSINYPEVVDKLVIWGSNSYISDDEIKILNLVRDVNKWSEKMREPMEKLYGPAGFAELWTNWIEGCLSIYREKKGDICKNDLGKIIAPTLILHGKKDPMVAAEHIPYLRKHIAGVEYFEFPDGKHNIHLRYADEFNKIVADFLNKN